MTGNIVLMRVIRGLTLVLAVALAPTVASAADMLPATEDILADRVLGKADAPVTLIEYASLTCPHCATFAKETLPTIKKEYVDTGKVKLIYRDYPLDGVALRAAMMARCAPKDRYYGLVETLFRTQETWARASDPVAALQRLGAVAGLSKESFDACLANKEIFDSIVSMRGKAEQEFKVNSTPSFVINGTKMIGDLSVGEFRKALDAAAAVKSK